MLIKSNKGYSNIPPLQNIMQDEGLEEVVYEDDEKWELLNKYFSFICWNALPCDSEECFGEGIAHFINILQVRK
jgi:hypothetical protein